MAIGIGRRSPAWPSARLDGPWLRRIVMPWLVALLVGCQPAGVPLLSGERLTTKGADDRWTLINYWATWCAPCRTEIPELNRLDLEADVRVVGVNFDQLEGEALQQAVTDLGIAFDVALTDPRSLWSYEIPQALPATVVISPEGQVRATLMGPQTEASLRQAMVR